MCWGTSGWVCEEPGLVGEVPPLDLLAHSTLCGQAPHRHPPAHVCGRTAPRVGGGAGLGPWGRFRLSSVTPPGREGLGLLKPTRSSDVHTPFFPVCSYPPRPMSEPDQWLQEVLSELPTAAWFTHGIYSPEPLSPNCLANSHESIMSLLSSMSTITLAFLMNDPRAGD